MMGAPRREIIPFYQLGAAFEKCKAACSVLCKNDEKILNKNIKRATDKLHASREKKRRINRIMLILESLPRV